MPVAFFDVAGVGATGKTYQVNGWFRIPGIAVFRADQSRPDASWTRACRFRRRRECRPLADAGSIVLSKSEGLLWSNRPTTSSSTPTPLASQNATAGIFGQNPNDFVNGRERLIARSPVVGKLRSCTKRRAACCSLELHAPDGVLYGRQIRVTGLGIRRRYGRSHSTQPTGAELDTIDLRIQKDFVLEAHEVGVFGDIMNLTTWMRPKSVGSQNGRRRTSACRHGT